VTIDLARELVTAGQALEDGSTLPSQWYTDPEIFALEQERIFGRAWQCVGELRDLSRPGDYLTARIGKVPVVVTHTDSGELAGLVNVCRHRAHEVAQGKGCRRTLQCPYHGWTYNLDGTLRAVPRADREAGFSLSGLDLLPVSVEVWESFVFVNVDKHPAPFRDVLGEVPALMSSYGFDFSELEHRKRIEYELAANWKVYVENSIECYHCPVAHAELSSVIDMRPDVYRLQADGYVISHQSRLRDQARSDGRAGPLMEQRAGVPEFLFFYVWPGFMIAPSPKRLWVGRMEPVSPGFTRVTADFYFEPGVDEAQVEESAAFSDRVLEEDRGLVESVQRGLASQAVPFGRLLPQSESLLRHFQRLVHGALVME
jgi:phenylpropionate dioxygenase-like ring-hydroxylating dioxygenase large terminal subunit